MKRVLYLGSLGYGNLGDELMFDVFKDTMYRMSDRHSILIQSISVDDDIREPYDALVLGGGSLFYPAYMEKLYHAVQAGKTVIIWGTGHDWLERERLDAVMKPGAPSLEGLLPVSFAEHFADVIKQARYVGVRGDFTRRALGQIVADLKNIEVSGDPGLLVDCAGSSLPDDVFPWHAQENVIAINFGTAFNNIFGNDERAVEDGLAIQCRQFINQGFKLFLFSMWEPDREALTRLYDKIGDPERVRMDNRQLNQCELLQIMRKCVLTVNFKLHANVISAAARVPFIALGYRFKSFDFADSLGLEDFVIGTDSSRIDEQIACLAARILENRDHIVQHLDERIEGYKQRLTAGLRKLVD